MTPAIAAWLRRQAACPEASGLVLRGSLLLSRWCSGARAPLDVDYLAPSGFDAERCQSLACAMAVKEPPIFLARTFVLYAETRFPGLRVVTGPERLQIDFGFDDPMAAPAQAIEIAGVTLLGCTPETLFGWKLHGLVEHGRGRWRAKDLYDLWLMWTRLPLDRVRLRAAAELAFSSRETPLAALDDFRYRPDWGQSRGGARKWRVLKIPEPLQLLEARQKVRHAVDAIWG